MKVALIQDSPVLFDLEASLQKAESLVAKANEQPVDLVLFPEAFLSAYPRGLSFGTVVGSRTEEGRDMWLRYWESSMKVPGPAVDRLSKIAKAYNCYLVLGVIERGDTGTLYCSILYFDSQGRLLGKHRKLKPTAAERIVWGEGDGKDLHVYDSPHGKLGGLICWENYMPLARTWLYQQGVEIYMAPTADQRDSWQATMQHIAYEGRCFVLGCNQYVTNVDYPKDLPGEDVSQLPEISSRGGSVIVDPLGKVIAGPLWDERGILTADLDMNLVTKGKLDFDPVGHYARNDVFQLQGPSTSPVKLS